MPAVQPTDHPPAAGQASAELTLGFEVTSLQLTPFFRLGSVQLRAISNVASLSLVAARQTSPLAAAVSFEIARVELDDGAQVRGLVLKPLGEPRGAAAPRSGPQVDGVTLAGEADPAPISVRASGAAPTAVQLVGTFALAAMEFTPAFEIESLRLEPARGTVLLRVSPPDGTGPPDASAAFEIAGVQLDGEAQIREMRLVPGVPGQP